VQNEFETTIKKVRSDNESKFKNTRIDELCDEYGIRHQFSAKYTPQSNGLVERKNKILIEIARSMLSEYNVNHSF
jgi:transposase InsO family protein